MKSILKVTSVFLLQNVFECLFMLIENTFGIRYVDFRTDGAGFLQSIPGVAYYYTFYKLLITFIPYAVVMMALWPVHSQFKFLFTANFFISIAITVIYWLAFENNLTDIANPLIATVVSGLIILIVGRKRFAD